LASFILNKVTD